jgi:hypothetical protein
MTFLDAPEGERLKAEGQQLALDWSGDWIDRAVLEFAGWLTVQRAMGMRVVTIEQFRAQAKAHPRSSNAWGALPRVLVARGLIKPSLNSEGEQRRQKAAAPKTHSHPVLCWEIA